MGKDTYTTMPMQKIDKVLWYPITGNQDDIPKRLKEWRKYRNLSLREVERQTGVSNAYLCQLETGKVCNPSFDVVVKLCRCYEVILGIR